MSSVAPDAERQTAGHLQRLSAAGNRVRYAVLGAGHGGLAMAGYLSLAGHPVSLYNRTDDQLNGVRWHGGVRITGAVSGFGAVETATCHLSEAVEGADVIMVVTPSTAHRVLAEQMAGSLRRGQIVILNPGRTGGALEFRHTLEEKGAAAVIVAETQTFLFASRAVSRHEAHIYRVKNSVPLATLPAYWIPQTVAAIRSALPGFVAGDSVLSTSLDNIGAVFHPALTLLNAGWIESTGGRFQYYLDGITPSVARVLEGIDRERVAIAEALGVRSISAREWLYLTYDSPGEDLYHAISNTKAYQGILAPATIAHRYIFEDVPMSLVPLASLGAQYGVPTPTIDLIVSMACLVHGKDYRAEGRTVRTLGIEGLSVKQLRHLVVGAPTA